MKHSRAIVFGCGMLLLLLLITAGLSGVTWRVKQNHVGRIQVMYPAQEAD